MSGDRGFRGGGGGRYGGGGGRGGRGGRGQIIRPVLEGTRIAIDKQLAEFRANVECDEIVFPADLSNHDRAIVHTECKKLGLKSKSHGKGEERRVHVTKPDKFIAVDADDSRTLNLSEKGTRQLNEYFSKFPPSSNELEMASRGTLDVAWEDENTKSRAENNNNNATTTTARKPYTDAFLTTFGNNVDYKRLHEELEHKRTHVHELAQISMKRQTLPVFKYKDEIIERVNANQVVLLAGSTGCGKTTQVPQFLLEDCWANGKPAKIICTQPRRISAMTVSDRIASERGENIGEGTVGYQIRLESKISKACSLLLVTTGVLLRRLTSEGADAYLSSLTHVIIDELHERDRFADFLMIVLKDVLPKYPNLKLILMSATMREDLFSNYFDDCPVIKVPGFIHPVREYHLEDVLAFTNWGGNNAGLANPQPSKHRKVDASSSFSSQQQQEPSTSEASEMMRAAIENAFVAPSDETFDWLLQCAAQSKDEDLVNVQHSATGATALMAAAGRNRTMEVSQLLQLGANVNLKSQNGMLASDWAERFEHEDLASQLRELESTPGNNDVAMMEEDGAARDGSFDGPVVLDEAALMRLSKYQLESDPDEVDVDLVCSLVKHVHEKNRAKPDGAILVFLPGWDEISKIKDALSDQAGLTDVQIMPLHSMVSPQDQRKVFQKPPRGVRKVVLSTNIAETAVTIDDVVYVIDSGKLKEKGYDAYTAVSTLHQTWISKASATQRKGRAGRVRPGEVYRLFSKSRFEAFAEFQLPEMQRSPLEEICLQVKMMQETLRGMIHSNGAPSPTCASFLKRAVEAPLPQAVDSAVTLLIDIGAFTSAEEDERITRLGRHLADLPLHPRVGKMLLYASLLGVLDPILTIACAGAYRPPFIIGTDSGRQNANRAKKGFSDALGGGSDHLAIVQAFKEWEVACRNGRQAENEFLWNNSLSGSTLHMIKGMRMQLITALTQRGFIQNLQSASYNTNATSLVRAVLAVGMYPLVGRMLPQCRAPTLGTLKGERVRIHPGSVNARFEFSQDELENTSSSTTTLACFEEITRNESNMYVRDSTLISGTSLVLIANTVKVEADPPVVDPLTGESFPKPGVPSALLNVDDWISFRVPLTQIAQLCTLRLRLFKAFASRVERTKKPLAANLQQCLHATSVVLADSDHNLLGARNQNIQRGGGGRGGGRGFYSGGRGGNNQNFVPPPPSSSQFNGSGDRRGGGRERGRGRGRGRY